MGSVLPCSGVHELGRCAMKPATVIALATGKRLPRSGNPSSPALSALMADLKQLDVILPEAVESFADQARAILDTVNGSKGAA